MIYKQITSKLMLGFVLLQLVSCNKEVKADQPTLQNLDLALNTEIEPIITKDSISKSEKIEEPFYYNVGSRFEPIKKSEIFQSITIHNYLNPIESLEIEQFESVDLIKIINNQQSDIRVSHNDQYFSNEQISFLKGLEYSEHYIVRINYNIKNTGSGKFENNHFKSHLTVVPETQASFKKGNEALLNYFKSNNSNLPKITDKTKFRATKFYFTITKNSTITNITSDWSTGYSEIDKQLLDLISKTNGLWNSAKNTKGENVDQDLVLTFSLPGGC
jgi:hypothetical protein